MLVVETDETDRKRLRDAVLAAGHESAGAVGSAAEALALAREAVPEVVLLDARLAAGFAAGPDLPVVLLTSCAEEERRVGADGAPPTYLRRPVAPEALVAAAALEGWKRRMVRELRLARAAASAAESAKTSFLATVSHELRTPMNGVLGMTELLLLSDLDGPYRENVDLIRQSALSLLSVLNQIIDYSRLEGGVLRLRETDFRMEDLLTGVLSQHRRAATVKGVGLGYVLDPAVPGWLRGDAGKIRQALGNLVDNGVKFTGAGRISVEVTLADRPPAAAGTDVVPVRVRVRDTGVGISPDRQESIFDSFVQDGDHLSHAASGGLGLGLAIVRRLASVLGGAVACASEPGEGSVFSLDLPLRRSRYEARSPLETVLGGDWTLTGVRILVAEDEPVNRRYLTRLLEKMGCVVAQAADGREAVTALGETPCDIVLMDVEMPEMSGIEATRAIRDPTTGCLDPTVPIVALTAHAMWGDEQRCLHAGMSDYLAKPADIEAVTAAIRSALENRRSVEGARVFSRTDAHGD